MQRRRFLATASGIISISLTNSAGVSGRVISNSSTDATDNPGPERESLPRYSISSTSNNIVEKYSDGSKIRPQQSDTEVVLSGELTGSFSSDVGRIRVDPSDSEIITAELLPDGSFATTVPTNEPLHIAYVQTDGDSGLVTLDGNPDVYYINRIEDGLQSDFDLGLVQIPEGHLLDVQVVNENGTPLDNVRTAVRSLNANSDDWWQIFYPTNSDGFYQTSNSPTGIEVNGEIEVAVLADTDDTRVPDVESTEQFTVTDSRTEVVTVDPITVNGRLTFANGSAASNQKLSIFVDQETSVETLSNSDGTFSMQVPPPPSKIVEGSYELQYYTQGLLDQETAVPIDGYADMYAGPKVDSSTNIDVGEITIPDGWLTRVRIVDSDGSGVEDATVYYRHQNDNLDTRASFVAPTNSTGNTPISGRTGLYLSGSVEINVAPPDDDAYADTFIQRELEINEPTTEEITLSPPVNITNITFSPEKVQSNSEHVLEFTAENISTDGERDTFSIDIPNNIDIISIGPVTTEPDYDLSPEIEGNTIVFAINPETPENNPITVDVTANITLSAGSNNESL